MSKDTPTVASLKDVAAKADVSSTTASLVLNGKTDQFAPATVARVRTAASELSYRPNAVARSLRKRRTNTIGLVSHEIATTPFAGATIRGALEAAWDLDHVLIVVDTEGPAEIEAKAISAILDRQIDGVVYARMKHEVVDVPRELAQTPTVLVDARPTSPGHAGVLPDESGGANAAVRHLIEAGHTRIGFIQSADDVPAAKERYIGYREAHAGAGLFVDPKYVVVDPSEGESPDVAIELLSRRDRPTALFCFNDRIAFGAYNAAHRLNLDIPSDVSVVGFDNHETIASRLDPGLTTMQLPYYDMGRWAVETLEQLIQGDEIDTKPVRMPCPLVERESVAAPLKDSDR